MGKSALLLVLVSMYGMAMSSSTKTQVFLERQDEQAMYEEKVLARERALTGFDMIVSGTENDFTNYRVDETSQSYRDGGFTYTTIGTSGDTVTVLATGTVGRAEYSIIGDLVKGGSARLGALNFDGPISRATARGASYGISGVNTIPNSDGMRAAAGANATGVYSVLKSAYDETVNGFRPELVTGGEMGDPGSFAHGEMNTKATENITDFDALGELILNACERPDPDENYEHCIVHDNSQVFAGNTVFGNPDAPVVMIVRGDATLRGTIHGYGVLYVEGNFRTEVGEPVWEGLVFASAVGGDHELRGSPHIYGATVLRSTYADGSPAVEKDDKEDLAPIDFLVRGEPKFFYSSQALLMLEKINTQFKVMLDGGSSEVSLVNVRQVADNGSYYTSNQ